MNRLIDAADAFSEYIRKACTDALNNYAIQDGLRDEKVTPTIELEPYRVRRMTREEAVARIKEHIEIHRYHERNAVKIFEALDMAIKALEQPETCEGCKHLNKWENEVEYGYPSPCTGCKRKAGDHYER